MEIQETSLPGVKIIKLDSFKDERGYFCELWQEEKVSGLGLNLPPIKQINFSFSYKGVIRGIHAEPWDKYIHVSQGKAFAAIVDLRQGEPTFGRYQAFELNQGVALYVPQGMGNSFQALEDTNYVYLVTDIWRGLENPYPAIAYNDPYLAIPWPMANPIISAKDLNNKTFKEAFNL